MNKLVIIDGNAIVHRAYHAIPPMHTKSGLMVNAVYGFTSMLLKTLRDLKPTHCAVTFDMAGGSRARLKKFKEYKGTRVKADKELYDQIPLAHSLVESFNIPIYEKSGFEADDVIGTIVREVHSQQPTANSPIEIYIVTGDMDTLQLVQKNVFVYTLKKGLSDTIIYDAKAVKDRYGFGPELMVDYKALRGDASDNIPGVPGIGEKGATDLIQKIGGIDEIYKQLVKNKEQIAKKIKDGVIKKLIEGEESARMSFELATVDTNVPDLNFELEKCRLKDFDKEKITTLFQKFEFVSLLKRLPGFAEDNLSEEKKSAGKKKTIVRSLSADFKFVEIKTKAEVKQLTEIIKQNKQLACRAIVQGSDIFTAKLNGLVFVVDGDGYFVNNDVIGRGGVTPPLHEIFNDPNILLIGHDLKQLIKILTITVGAWHAKPLQGQFPLQCQLFDTMIASYLLQPGSRAHDIPRIIFKVLGKTLGAGAGQESLFGLDAKTASYELYLISLAAEKLRAELEKADNFGLFNKIEMPLISVLADLELNGIAVDNKKLAELSLEVNSKIKTISAKIFELAGREFNISSPLQLREVLFDELQIPVQGIKKGKTGLSTAAEQLEKMRGLHPIIDLIQDYRELSKLQNTYIDVLPNLVNKTTHRIHTTFNQAVTATGRLSSSDPNLQNIPVRTELGREIRKAFVAEPGNVLLSADYSQIELRIVASLAQDKKMLEIFEAGEDIHTATAAAIHGVPLKDVTKEMRRSAKEVNFGVLYGMGAYGLAWRAEIPQYEAKAFIEKYFSEFSGVKKYLEATLEFTRQNGYCETLFGRRRYIPELNADNFQVRSAAERMAINHPIQGTAADLLKMAMIAIKDVIARSPAKRGDEAISSSVGNVRMLLQVHDELVFEVEKEYANKLGALVKQTMESVVTLRVPIVAEIKTGLNWGEMK